ncbi:hypothetical protein HY024_02595 [Candidatus Curtissbacteria bacterium]|nr:hypothetical protein [Candidatus Curtissbacteria bacterium]
MQNNFIKKPGIASLAIVAVVGLVIVLGAVFLLNSKGQTASTPGAQNQTLTSPAPDASMAPLTKGDTVTDIDTDLNSTNTNQVDADLKVLDSSFN